MKFHYKIISENLVDLKMVIEPEKVPGLIPHIECRFGGVAIKGFKVHPSVDDRLLMEVVSVAGTRLWVQGDWEFKNYDRRHKRLINIQVLTPLEIQEENPVLFFFGPNLFKLFNEVRLSASAPIPLQRSGLGRTINTSLMEMREQIVAIGYDPQSTDHRVLVVGLNNGSKIYLERLQRWRAYDEEVWAQKNQRINLKFRGLHGAAFNESWPTQGRLPVIIYTSNWTTIWEEIHR